MNSIRHWINFPALRTPFVRFASSASPKNKTSSSKRWLKRAQNDHYSREAKEKDYKSRAAFKLLQIDAKFKLFRPGQNVVDLGFAPGAWSQVAFERTNQTGTILGVDILACQPIRGVSSMQANILSKQTHENIWKFFLEKQILKSTGKLSDEQLVSYIDQELKELKINEQELELSKVSNRYPLDVVISDMCAAFFQTTGFWNMTTNAPYFRMANTSGLQVRDHLNSMVSNESKNYGNPSNEITNGNQDLCDAALILAIDLLKPKGSFTCKFYTGKEDKLLEKRLSRVFREVHRYKPDACRDDSKECYFVCLNKRETIDKLLVFS